MTINPPKLDEADERLTQEQYDTFAQDMADNPGKVGLHGFNDAGWLCYEIEYEFSTVLVSVAPDGEAYVGRDAHLRRHQD